MIVVPMTTVPPSFQVKHGHVAFGIPERPKFAAAQVSTAFAIRDVSIAKSRSYTVLSSRSIGLPGV